jgi:hypothetical protein
MIQFLKNLFTFKAKEKKEDALKVKLYKLWILTHCRIWLKNQGIGLICIGFLEARRELLELEPEDFRDIQLAHRQLFQGVTEALIDSDRNFPTLVKNKLKQMGVNDLNPGKNFIHTQRLNWLDDMYEAVLQDKPFPKPNITLTLLNDPGDLYF